MKNKKISLVALAMLIIGAGASIAYQSHAAQIAQPAPVQATVSASAQTDQTVDQKDANGKDLETNDDTKSVLGEKNDSANDNDSDSKSEQNEKDSGQAENGNE